MKGHRFDSFCEDSDFRFPSVLTEKSHLLLQYYHRPTYALDRPRREVVLEARCPHLLYPLSALSA